MFLNYDFDTHYKCFLNIYICFFPMSKSDYFQWWQTIFLSVSLLCRCYCDCAWHKSLCVLSLCVCVWPYPLHCTLFSSTFSLCEIRSTTMIKEYYHKKHQNSNTFYRLSPFLFYWLNMFFRELLLRKYHLGMAQICIVGMQSIAEG